jgi:hypothetical protein
MITRRLLLLGAPSTVALTVLGCHKAPTELRCDDVDALTPAERTLRLDTLGYVDRSPYPAKVCEGCQLFRGGSPDACGSCSVLKGPVHAKGYCKSWIARSPL